MITNRFAYFACLMIATLATIAVRLSAHDTEMSAASTDELIQRLATMPSQFGEWQLKSDQRLDDRTVKMLRCAGHLNRRYVSTVNGDVVDLVLMVGPSGPLLAHTPDVCMNSREFEQIEGSGPTTIHPGGESANVFLKTAYRARTLEGQTLRLYYAWSRDAKKWEGPNQPRLTLGDSAMLYKLQVTSVHTGANAADNHDTCRRFLADLSSNWK